MRIGRQLRVIVLRRQRQRRSAGPASDHLRRQECLLLGAGAVRAQVPAPGRHVGADLAYGRVGSIAPQHVGTGHGRQAAGFVGVAEDELARFDGDFLRVGTGQPDALDVRVADAVTEAEGGAPGRQLVDVLLPDHLDTGRVLVGDTGPLQLLVQLRRIGRQGAQRDMNLARSERCLPVGRSTLAHIPDQLRPSGHALTKRPRKAVQRLLRHPQGPQPLVGERHSHPGILTPVRAGQTTRGHREQPPQQGTPGMAVIDAQEDELSLVRHRPWTQRPALDVVDLDAHADCAAAVRRVHVCFCLRIGLCLDSSTAADRRASTRVQRCWVGCEGWRGPGARQRLPPSASGRRAWPAARRSPGCRALHGTRGCPVPPGTPRPRAGPSRSAERSGRGTS